jgi:LmbE family N-acetylglucosaminyl deacetylase
LTIYLEFPMRHAGDIISQFEHFPLRPAGATLSHARLMVLIPHPDDESLGCGGLIAACCAAGLPPVVVMLTDGAASHPDSYDYPPERLGALRQQEAMAAVQCLGLPPENLVFLGYADAALPADGLAFAEAVARMASIAVAQNCAVIVGPWAQDPHGDHVAGALMAEALAARLGLPLWAYPVWGWLLPPEVPLDVGDISGFRLDISEFLAAKQAAIAAHRSQNGGLVTDSAAGFSLPESLLAIFARPYEVFVAA